jgi:parvulin-like peptidyl-prolyl isomerase
MEEFMRSLCQAFAILVVFPVSWARGQAQEQVAQPAQSTPATAIAATVNGKPIPEADVLRGLKGLPADVQAQARADIVNHLIDMTLLDQYLLELHVEVPQKDIDARVGELREELKKSGKTIEKMLQELTLTEEELKNQLTAELRWEKYTDQKVTEQTLRAYFDKNPEMFDGTTVHARHILLTPASADPQAAEQAQTRLVSIKKQIEEEAAKELAKLPPEAVGEAREKTRTKAIENAFAEIAKKESACPSKNQGGDLGWFPRAGTMVEPFAKAAFALKPYEMSDIVVTRFGCHLILAIERRPGKETKFEDVKDVVRDAYCERMSEAYCAQLRAKAKITVNPPPK